MCSLKKAVDFLRAQQTTNKKYRSQTTRNTMNTSTPADKKPGWFARRTPVQKGIVFFAALFLIFVAFIIYGLNDANKRINPPPATPAEVAAAKAAATPEQLRIIKADVLKEVGLEIEGIFGQGVTSVKFVGEAYKELQAANATLVAENTRLTKLISESVSKDAVDQFKKKLTAQNEELKNKNKALEEEATKLKLAANGAQLLAETKEPGENTATPTAPETDEEYLKEKAPSTTPRPEVRAEAPRSQARPAATPRPTIRDRATAPRSETRSSGDLVDQIISAYSTGPGNVQVNRELGKARLRDSRESVSISEIYRRSPSFRFQEADLEREMRGRYGNR